MSCFYHLKWRAYKKGNLSSIVELMILDEGHSVENMYLFGAKNIKKIPSTEKERTTLFKRKYRHFQFINRIK